MISNKKSSNNNHFSNIYQLLILYTLKHSISELFLPLKSSYQNKINNTFLNILIYIINHYLGKFHQNLLFIYLCSNSLPNQNTPNISNMINNSSLNSRNSLQFLLPFITLFLCHFHSKIYNISMKSELMILLDLLTSLLLEKMKILLSN